MAIAFGLIGDGLRDVVADRRQARGSGRPALVRGPGAAPEAPAPLLAVRDYSIAFATAHGDRTVVDAIDFEVERGEIVGLVGESGSGKTVTALSLLGLLPDNGGVTTGAAWLDGRIVSPAPEHEIRHVRGREIGLVSQEPMVALDPHFTIGAQLGEVIRRVGDVKKSRGAVEKKAIELLSAVRLTEPDAVLRRHPHELSGGMLQRVVIAMALAGSPRLLLADEPTTALDVTVQAEILDLIRSLRDERGMSVILVTHDLGVVADICDRAIVMERGRIVESAPVEQLFADPHHPYTRALLASTPNIVRNLDD
jgi:peptide/nickel transport system permease protein